MPLSLQRTWFRPRSRRARIRGETCLAAHDEQVDDPLRLAATILADQALETADPHAARLLMQASAVIVAVARAHDRLLELDLEDREALARATPALCVDLCACFEHAGETTAEAASDAASFVAVAMPEGGVVAELVGGFMRRSVYERERTICVLLERDPWGVCRISVAVTGGEQGRRRLVQAQRLRPPGEPVIDGDAGIASFG